MLILWALKSPRKCQEKLDKQLSLILSLSIFKYEWRSTTNYKFKALLILLLCLFVPDLKLHSKHEGYLKNFIYNKKDSASDFLDR